MCWSSRVCLFAVAVGIPLKEIASFEHSAAASQYGVKNGVIVDVRKSATVEVGPTNSRPSPALGPQQASPPPPLPEEESISSTGPWGCSACTFMNENPTSIGCEMCGTERPAPLIRQIVPADNQCLFTSIGYVIDKAMDRARHYRQAVANAIAGSSSELELSEAELGKSPAEYAEYISRQDIWGGGIELSVLSKLLRTEVAAVEVRSGRLYTFGEGKGYSQRVYLVFDGIHYDALHRKNGDGSITTVFTVEDEAARASVLAVAGKLREGAQFVDLAGFTLRCGVCQQGLTGESEALTHAKATGHTNFAEYKT